MHCIFGIFRPLQIPFTPKPLQINSPPGFFFVIFTGIRCGHRFFFVTPMCGVFCFFLGGGGWKFVFVIFTKLIPRRNFFLYCEHFGVDGKSCMRQVPPAWHYETNSLDGGTCALVTGFQSRPILGPRMKAFRTLKNCLD